MTENLVVFLHCFFATMTCHVRMLEKKKSPENGMFYFCLSVYIVFCLYECLCTHSCSTKRRPGASAGSLGLELRKSCKTLSGCWGSNLGPLQEQVLLTTVPLLQPSNFTSLSFSSIQPWIFSRLISCHHEKHCAQHRGYHLDYHCRRFIKGQIHTSPATPIRFVSMQANSK